MKKNKVVRISLSAGLIGLLSTSPRRALETQIEKENKEGWNAIYILPHVETNLFAAILRLMVLCVTLSLWTWGAGYLILFERDSTGQKPTESA